MCGTPAAVRGKEREERGNTQLYTGVFMVVLFFKSNENKNWSCWNN